MPKRSSSTSRLFPSLLFGSVLTALVLSPTMMRGQILPPPAALSGNSNTLSFAPRLFVRDFRFEGNHVFTSAELGKVVSSFTNRWLNTENLEEARRAVTLYYVSRNYINSGAVIPDQNPTNGIVRIQIVEGVLSGIELHGNRWLRDSYIKSRIKRSAGPPLNVNEAQEGLQLLRQNPNVQQINAELKPGVAPGQSELDLRVVDRQPFHFGLQADNQRPPTVGAEEIWALLSDENLTGNSDPLRIQYGIANATSQGFDFSGIDNMEGSYLLPITRFDTTLAFNASRLNTSIIENAFQSAHIKSLTSSYGAVLRQPVYQTANQEAGVSIGFDWRENKTSALGSSAAISPGATPNGEMIVAPLRFSQDWTLRGQSHVLALRSTFSVGLDVLGATDDGIRGDPNAKFFSWLGQGQYIQRLFNTQNQLVLRLSGQWTPDPLLALEQFSVGGLDTVRGYPENQLVRDRAIVSSMEFRLPLLFNKAGAGVLQFAPFFDFGGAWNVNPAVEGSTRPNTIYSTGAGLLLTANKYVSGGFYWGYRLHHVEVPPDSGAQGLGISFKVNVTAF